MNHVTSNIIKIRKSMNLNQPEFGKFIGRSYSAVNHWETGRNEVPLFVIVKLSDVSGISIDDIVRKELYEIADIKL